MNYQGNMFGAPDPVFDDCPGWLEQYCKRIYWLYGEGSDQNIADDDYYLQVKYWITYEGLGKVLGEDALMRFADWFTKSRPTPPETLRRARQWLTSEDSDRQPYMSQSSDAKARRNRKRQMISKQMGDGND